MTEKYVAFILATIFLAVLVSPSHYTTPQGIINPFDCKTVDGTVIQKQQNDTGNILYVELDYKEQTRGYRVYVSPTTYEEFELNETYSEKVCNTWDYEVGVENLINNLTAWGIVEALD
tara:strand:+ start:2246 stop:2599 length:354 start_codon:yes stop_codon:yes gene_type:complete